MIEIKFTNTFLKKYKKLSSQLKQRVAKRIDLFQSDPYHNSLHSHKLQGTMKSTFSFSVTGDIRIVYYWKDNIAVFVAIGKHDEIYK